LKRRIATCVPLLLALGAAIGTAQDIATPKRVLALFWDGPDFPSYPGIKRGILQGFRSMPPGALQYYEEYLESDRFPAATYPQVMASYLRDKYADRHIDLVLCITTAPLNFMLEQDTLFPDADIVFSTSRLPPPGRRTPQMTGVVYSPAYGETLALALRLHPGTTEAYVVTGTPERDGRLAEDVRVQLQRFGSRVPVTYWTDRPVTELVDQVRQLPPTAVILQPRQSEFLPAGELLPHDIQDVIANASTVPVYGTSHHSVGRGFVGGYVINTETYGAQLAEIAGRVLNGTPPSQIPVVVAPPVPVFDWRQLRRWGISEDQLPPGSALLFREVTAWQQNRGYIIAALSVIALESALVAALLLHRARRRRVEAALRDSEARYRDVVETQTELICRYLPDTTLTFVNDAYCRFWRKRREDLVGTKFLELIPAERRDDVARRISTLVEYRREVSQEHEVLLPDGSIGWQHWANHALPGADGRVVELQAIGRDITVRKRAEEALRVTGEALRVSSERVEDLAGRLIAAQEAERKRIARDLHDDLSQKLALLSIDIEQLPRRAPVELRDNVREISDRAAEIATDVHRLAYTLHPSKLESLGLVAALESVCRDISRQHDLQVDFEHGNIPADVPADIALCLYRIVQEALNNVIKHSGARHAKVELRAAGDLLELHVADPGVGFVASARGNGGLGLVSMRERVNFVGGQITIHSAPGAGTRIGVRVSVSKPPSAVLSSPSLRLGA
jgi:PAS domain S-box-containing protein